MGVWHGCAVFGKRFVEQGTPAHILNTGSENSVGIPHTHAGFYTASSTVCPMTCRSHGR